MINHKNGIGYDQRQTMTCGVSNPKISDMFKCASHSKINLKTWCVIQLLEHKTKNVIKK